MAAQGWFDPSLFKEAWFAEVVLPEGWWDDPMLNGAASDPTRTAQVSWAEMEVPPPPDRAQVSWTELEVPSELPRQCYVSWAELEVPYALHLTRLKLKSLVHRAMVSHVELEVP